MDVASEIEKPAPQTFVDVIELWPTAVQMAAELGELEVTVRAWKRRKSIPADRWLRVIEAARQRGIKNLSLDLFAKLAAADPASSAEAAA